MKSIKTRFLFLFIFLITTAAGCGSGLVREVEPTNLTVATASSLKDIAAELSGLYTIQHPEAAINYVFASSGVLQKQIEEGAPIDLFISAGVSQMDALAAKGLIVEGSRKDLLGNELVLIGGRDCRISGFEDLVQTPVEKISIGLPETVPAGQYARETLTRLNLWEPLLPKMVFARDVQQVLTYVSTGNVDAGIVYRTDALRAAGVRLVAAAPGDSHRPIVYPLAVVKNSRQQRAAEEFARYLLSEEAAGVFIKHGFINVRK